MPRRDDIEWVLVLGSGPIRIGQAAEFDFSLPSHPSIERRWIQSHSRQFKSSNNSKRS